jgi:RHS repeat-associated protein
LSDFEALSTSVDLSVDDQAGRTNSFAGDLGDGHPRTYAGAMVYSATGALAKEQFGTDTPVFNKLFYNTRGQLAEIRESTSYSGPTDTTWDRGAIINHCSNQASCWGAACNATDNNGNLRRQEVYIPRANSTDWDNFAQFYEYDALNRLQSVRENENGGAVQWQQQYVYDRYGNRTLEQDVTKTFGVGINKKDFTANTANDKRLGVPGGQTGTMSYDLAGNLTTDTYSAAAVTRAYDAENRMTSETQARSYVAGVYTYNADGQRARRKVSAVETWQVYGFDGELLAEYAKQGTATAPQKEYGYRNGQLLVTTELKSGDPTLQWLVTDQPGTPRLIFDKTGTLAGVKRHDYLPFGEEIFADSGGRTTTMGYTGATDRVRQKFTDKERDAETGLDYFLARYYSSTQGRFTSPDEFSGGPDELYAVYTKYLTLPRRFGK